MDVQQQTIAFIGAGKMATALASGIVAGGVMPPSNIIGCARTDLSLTNFKKGAEKKEEKGEEGEGVVVSERNEEGVMFQGGVDILVLSVKPQVMKGVAEEVGRAIKKLHKKPIIVSVAAGIPIETLQKYIEGEEEKERELKYIRVMPNTPAFVQEGALAYSLGPGLTKEVEGKMIETLFGSVGMVKCVPEQSMDAVVGVSGSGPAYVYQFIEALSDAGVRQGLTRDLANDLAVQTVLGAAKMVKDTKLHPAVLKDQVTSPGGTTIAAIEALEKAGLRAAVFDGVNAATERSRELGKS
mmetsp:Transcript_37576/g.59282  ORF Transcript_37576/g.59282 Transcript_37576/m.59282 type:complete len:297 (-) Transcript_37576:87-977(-)